MKELLTSKPQNPEFGDTYYDAENKKQYVWNYTAWLECHRVSLVSDTATLAAVSWLQAHGVTRITLTGGRPREGGHQVRGSAPAILFQSLPGNPMHMVLPGDLLVEAQGAMPIQVWNEQNM